MKNLTFDSDNLFYPVYAVKHFFEDMLPYYFFGNTRNDADGGLKWVINLTKYIYTPVFLFGVCGLSVQYCFGSVAIIAILF